MPPVVILCGGRGMRLSGGDAADVPKPLVEIGGIPILLHVMRIYAAAGCTCFVLCLGYKGGAIREWFIAHRALWAGMDVTFVDTGLDTETGGRLKRVEKLVAGGAFLVGYADGVSDVSVAALLGAHRRSGLVATMTCVRPGTHYGVVHLDGDVVAAYEEKQRLSEQVNGGFFCFDLSVFDFIKDGEALEREPMQRLVRAGQLGGFVHDGFWACMDTPKDHKILNELWDRGEAPWVCPGIADEDGKIG